MFRRLGEGSQAHVSHIEHLSGKVSAFVEGRNALLSADQARVWPKTMYEPESNIVHRNDRPVMLHRIVFNGGPVFISNAVLCPFRLATILTQEFLSLLPFKLNAFVSFRWSHPKIHPAAAIKDKSKFMACDVRLPRGWGIVSPHVNTRWSRRYRDS